MRMIQWEPFRDLDTVFDRFLTDSLRRTGRTGAQTQPSYDWAPVADISETDNEYVIKVELPEVRKEDVSITVQDSILTVSGERKFEKRAEGEKVHRLERSYGTFARRFALPEQIDEQAIRAEGQDGVIRIHVPKQAVVPPQPRQITIQ